MHPEHSHPIRVTVIEDHDDFREGLCHVLQHTEGFLCVGKFGAVEDALPRIPECDVILLDINLPGKSGIEGMADLKNKRPEAHVIMLTVFEDDTKIFQSIQAGADGYLLKKTPPAKLLEAIQEAASGGMPMTPFVARQAITMLKRLAPQVQSQVTFTPRESEILELLAQGLNYGPIGDKLFISLDTVRNHIRHIYEKLQVHSKAEAVAKAIKHGLL